MSTNSNLPKDELISKLEAISVLRDKALSIKQKMENFVPEDIYERKVVVPVFPGEYKSDDERKRCETSIDHSEDNAVELMAKSYDRLIGPQKPKEPKVKEFEYKTDNETLDKQFKWKLYSYFAAAFAVVYFLFTRLAGGAVYTIIPALLFLFFRYKLKNDIEAEKKKKEEAFVKYTNHKNKLAEEYQKELENYESENFAYQLRRQDFLDEYVKWREIYLESKDEEAQIEEELESDRVAAVEKINADELTPILLELLEVNNGLITNEYLPAIDIIIDLLKSGRADDVKEAINLYEDTLYRERQLKLQREIEEKKLYQEELRRQDEERHYQEDKKFREDQARKEELRHKNEMDQRIRQEKDQKLQEIEERRNTERQCWSCKEYSHCSMRLNKPNCAGFRPK